MSRSIWKGINKKSINNHIIKLSRFDMIIPDYINHTVQIHMGKEWKNIIIKNIHIGQKAGEFAPTKYPAVFKRNKRKIGRIKYGT